MAAIALLSDIAAAGVRFFVCQLLISRLLQAGTSRHPAAAGFAGIAVLSLALSLLHSGDVSRIGAEAVWAAFCAGRMQKTEGKMQKTEGRMYLYISIYYEIAVFFWQFLFAAWMGVFFHSASFLDARTLGGQAAVWLFHGTLAALALFLSRRQDMAQRHAARLATGILLAGLFAVISLAEQDVLTFADDTLDTWMILAVVLLASIQIFYMNRQYNAEKELAGLKARQAELLERDYTTLNAAYAVNAKLFHDFHNHIGALRQLLSHQKYEEAVQYLDGLQAPVREMTDTVWTGDETADYLINSKSAVAKENGIQLQAQVEFPRHSNIRSADLCAILGNLLDNALEAVRQVPDREQRTVQLTIRRINQMLVIKVENRFSAAPVKENGTLITTKTQGGLHGWGLKSAQAAAEKYDGMVQTTYSGNTFRAVATLSYEGVPK